MVFVVYKINLPDKNVYTSGVYEQEIDAINQKKELMSHKTPEEAEQELFEIHEVPLWTAKDMMKNRDASFYTEEDNNVDEPTFQEDMQDIKNILNSIKSKIENVHYSSNSNIIEYATFITMLLITLIIVSIIIILAVNTK